MANSTRICKVCGKEYPYCKTELRNGDIFRWQDVACCAEHGSEYFAAIAASRGETPVSKNVVKDEEIIEVEFVDEDEDEEEEDDFSDDEDDEEDI